MGDIGTLKIGAGRFLYGKGAVQMLPEEIRRYGKKAFAVGGKTTLPLIKNAVGKEIEDKGVQGSWVIMDEPNSMDFAKRLSVRAVAECADVIVAVGGGKCMDLCKVVSDMAKLPLITVPTSIATCAGSSAVSIMYTKEEARYDCSVPKEKEVDSVIADLSIIGDSPARLFAAGIMDSIAKLPEIVNGREKMDYPGVSVFKKMAYLNSTFIYEFLTNYGIKIYQKPKEDETLLRDIVLVNLLITSMVSGFSSGSDQLAVAHGLYDGIRKLYPQESKDALHGEIVAVGVLMQLRFNGDEEAEYQKIKQLMSAMNMPLKLKDLGVEATRENIEALKAYNIQSNHMTLAEDLERLEMAFKEIV